jgi:hypothetical protein
MRSPLGREFTYMPMYWYVSIVYTSAIHKRYDKILDFSYLQFYTHASGLYVSIVYTSAIHKRYDKILDFSYLQFYTHASGLGMREFLGTKLRNINL